MWGAQRGLEPLLPPGKAGPWASAAPCPVQSVPVTTAAGKRPPEKEVTVATAPDPTITAPRTGAHGGGGGARTPWPRGPGPARVSAAQGPREGEGSGALSGLEEGARDTPVLASHHVGGGAPRAEPLLQPKVVRVGPAESGLVTGARLLRGTQRSSCRCSGLKMQAPPFIQSLIHPTNAVGCSLCGRGTEWRADRPPPPAPAGEWVRGGRALPRGRAWGPTALAAAPLVPPEGPPLPP